jgi:DNA-binding NarL/FixJ family response regulator
MEDSIRVLIADDHPLFRDGMLGLLGSLADKDSLIFLCEPLGSIHTLGT